jgi:hypothetical protein
MHPAWSALRLFIILGWATAMLWVTATEFDQTELRALGGIAIGLGGIQILELLGVSHGKSSRKNRDKRHLENRP